MEKNHHHNRHSLAPGAITEGYHDCWYWISYRSCRAIIASLEVIHKCTHCHLTTMPRIKARLKMLIPGSSGTIPQPCSPQMFLKETLDRNYPTQSSSGFVTYHHFLQGSEILPLPNHVWIKEKVLHTLFLIATQCTDLWGITVYNSLKMYTCSYFQFKDCNKVSYNQHNLDVPLGCFCRVSLLREIHTLLHIIWLSCMMLSRKLHCSNVHHAPLLL